MNIDRVLWDDVEQCVVGQNMRLLREKSCKYSFFHSILISDFESLQIFFFKCLILCTLFTFYFGALSALAPIFVWLLILRGLVGFGIGGAPQSVTLYAEFLPSNQRARCVILTNVFWSIGACLEVLLAIFVMPNLGWRWLLAFSALPLLVFVMFCSWLPESARFNLARGQPDLAYETLKTISQENKKPLPEGKLAVIKVELQNFMTLKVKFVIYDLRLYLRMN